MPAYCRIHGCKLVMNRKGALVCPKCEKEGRGSSPID